MPTLASVSRRIHKEGDMILLRRVGAPSLEIRGKVRGYSAQELIGDVQQGDREVRMSNQEILDNSWPGPPQRGDKMTINGKVATVQSVETVQLRGRDAMHIVQVRGA